LPQNNEEMEQAVRIPVPDELKKQYEERTGYANFYFNRENAQRVWKALSGQSDFSKASGSWTIGGQQIVAAPMFGMPSTLPAVTGAVTIRLTDSECDFDSPIPPATKITLTDGIDAATNPAVLGPPGSGGLLASLHLWRKLLTGGPGKYGQVLYEGTAPVPGHDGLCDVLLAIGEGVETRFYCEPQSGTLVCMEMYPDEESDPCEVYFTDYRMERGLNMPHRMEVHCGDTLFGVFALTRFDLQSTAAKSSKSAGDQSESEAIEP
jgi:serine protease Do